MAARVVTGKRALQALAPGFYRDVAGAVVCAIIGGELWNLYKKNDIRLIKEANERFQQKRQRMREELLHAAEVEREAAMKGRRGKVAERA